jgi:phospholipase C
MSLPPITNLFVLVLENRAFDHMLGFSGITGTDAVTGKSTSLNGLKGSESNSFNGATFTVSKPAEFSMAVGPGHEFPDALEQLCGPGAQYPSGGPYPPINNSGYVADFVASGGQANPGDIMKCYDPTQLPVLVALANEFAVCDNWFSSMPGPTWPNRFFTLAASSGGLDHSPSANEMIRWESVDGFRFQNGSIFDQQNLSFWRIYAGGDLSITQALKGITVFDITSYASFANDVSLPSYPYQFTYIEPNYGQVLTDYKGGTSQHPLDDVTSGEALIKQTYEAIRSSQHWNSSMLIITWDEHGGFYDHATPPGAVTPGDSPQMASVSQFGFDFRQYGARVPAVVVSPLVSQNVIDHRLYDHASIPATAEKLFGLNAMTQRDAQANTVLSLASLATPRNTPAKLPNPAVGLAGLRAMVESAQELPGPPPTNPLGSVEQDRNTPGFLLVAMRSDLDLSPPSQRPAIIARVQSIRTRAQAHAYIEEVRPKIYAARAAAAAASRSRITPRKAYEAGTRS